MRFESLDGWRGVAAILVALYHLEFLNHLYDVSLLRNSFLFVDFFFVLSGFVIVHAYKDRLSDLANVGTFIKKRFARLWPLHIFVLVLFVAFEISKLILQSHGDWNADNQAFTNEYSIASLVSNIFLVQSLGLHDYLTWNYPSWSISVEFYTYIVFAIVALIFATSRSLASVSVIFLIISSVYILYGVSDDVAEITYSFGIFRCILGFFLGVLTYFVFRKTKPITNKSLASLLELLAILFIAYFVSVYGSDKISVVVAPVFFAMVVFIFASEQGILSVLLKTRLFQNLGKWSYSIYMMHAFILLFIGRSINVSEVVLKKEFHQIHHSTFSNKSIELIKFDNIYIMDVLTVLYVIVVVYVSSLTYKYIEVRGAGWFKKTSRRGT